MPGKLRKRTQGGEGLAKQEPETSTLPLLQASALEAGIPGALALEGDLAARGFWEAGILQQWKLVEQLFFERIEQAPDPLSHALAMTQHADGRLRFFAPGMLARLHLHEPELGLEYLKPLAQDEDRSVQEATQSFGVRTLLLHVGPDLLAALKGWSLEEDPRIRRAGVEGSRPRGVWVQRLAWAVETPSLLLPLIEPIRMDEDRYPANAAANCLNDMAKDSPRLVLDIATAWLAESPQGPLLQHIVSKGLRGLVKAGHPSALRLMGFGDLEVKVTARLLDGPQVRPNSAIPFEVTIQNFGKASDAKLVWEIQVPGKNPAKPRSKRYQGKTLRLPGKDSLVVSCNERVFDTKAAPMIDGDGVLRCFLNGAQVAEASFQIKRPV